MKKLKSRNTAIFEFFKYLKFLIKHIARAGVAVSPTDKIRIDSLEYALLPLFSKAIEIYESLLILQRLLCVISVVQK